MGLRAIDAVQRCSQYRHDKAENFIPYRIMTAIAWYADDSGIAGVAGEPKKCPTIDTIAERAAVHRNTILNWLPQLKEAGELSTEKHGAGRGSHVVYTILLAVDPIPLPDIGTNDYENGTSFQSGDVPITSHSDDVLAEIKALLVHQNELLVQALVQANGTNGTSFQSDDVPDPDDPFSDPDDPEREETPAPANGFWSLPDNLNTTEFIKVWSQWLNYVDERDLSFTETQADMTLTELSEAGLKAAVSGVTTSIRRGWKNVYLGDPPSSNGRHPPAKQKDDGIPKDVIWT